MNKLRSTTKKKKRGNGTGTLRQINGTYYAVFCIRDELTGKRNRISKTLKTKDKAVATQRLNELFSEYSLRGAIVNPETSSLKGLEAREAFNLRLQEKSNAISYQKQLQEAQRKKVEELQLAEDERRRAEEEERCSIGLADGFVFYSSSKKRSDSSERTLSGYEAHYNNFVNWMRENYPSITKIHDVTSEMAEEFLDFVAKTRSRNTRNKHLTTLRMVWRVLRWEESSLMSIDPWDGIKKLKQIPDTIRHRDLTFEEIRSVLRVIKTDEMAKTLSFVKTPYANDSFEAHTIDLRDELFTMFLLSIYTGCRLGDCCTIKKEAISFEANTIKVQPRKTARNYAWEIIIPIHKALRAHLCNLPSMGNGYLLPNLAEIYLKREPSIITNRIQKIFQAVGIQTTVDAPEISGGKRRRVVVGYHSLRHYFASMLANANVNQEMINYLTSHKQSQVTATYYHRNNTALEKAISSIPIFTEALPLNSEIRMECAESNNRDAILTTLASLDIEALKEISEFITKKNVNYSNERPLSSFLISEAT